MKIRLGPSFIAIGCLLFTGLINAAPADEYGNIRLISEKIDTAATRDLPGETGAQFKKNFIRPRTIPFPKHNPYTAEKARLGKLLFFDPRLSGSGSKSCATCHNPGLSWSDGLPVAVGDRMNRLSRRTPSIVNVAWGEVFTWDGRKRTLEDHVLGPISGKREMNLPIQELIAKLRGIKDYRRMFNVAFGPASITPENITRAIATFERTIQSDIAPFDRWIEGDRDAIPEDAKKGFVLFNTKARCADCHSSWLFTDDSFHDIGLPGRDLGRGKFFPGEIKMQYAFKTPGLRNTTRRAPYMHDGSIANLAGVIHHYNKGGINRPSRSDDIRPLNLSEEEQKLIIEFLETLSGTDRLVSLPHLPQ